MAQQYFYTSNAVQTTLSASLGAVAAGSTGQTIQVTSTAGWPTQFPAPMLLEWGTVSQERVTLTQAATGSGPFTFANCIRGDDGTAAPAHGIGAAVYHGVTAVDYFQTAPVFNGCAYGADPTGVSATSNVGIQAALDACSAAGGGTVVLSPGLYQISQTLQIHSNTTLQGAGVQVTTIRAKASFQPTQVGTNTGAPLTASYGNGGQGASIQSNIRVTGITFDGNQANNLTTPGTAFGADAPECSAFSLWYCDNVTIDGIETINSVGYSLYVHFVTNFSIRNCRVLAGQTPSTGYVQQDGIHTTDCQYGVITGNDVDTGPSTSNTAGDDAIAVLAYTAASNIAITGNVLRAAQSGVDVALASNGSTPTLISGITITGNTIWQSVTDGVTLSVFTWFAGSLISDVTISGNTFNNTGISATYACGGFTTQNYVNSNAFWQNVTITGNSYGTFGTPAGSIWGIWASLGSGLTISGNTFPTYSGTNPCIQIGGSGLPVTDFAITGNEIICTASTVSGILVEDSTIGSINGNTIHGALGAGSDGIHLLTGTIAVIGIAVNGNRIYNFATGIVESGSPTPDYNSYFGNNSHGCTAFMTLTGTNDLPVNANTATLNLNH